MSEPTANNAPSENVRGGGSGPFDDEERNELIEKYKIDPSTEPVKCDLCSKVAIVRMPECKENNTLEIGPPGHFYHYCDEHFDPQGECEECGVDMNGSWDIATRICRTFCRPCGKHHDNEGCEICFEKESDEESVE